VLAVLFPAREHSYRRQNYAKYEKHLNLDGLEFPLATKDIAKFEAQNPTIAIHCIAADSKDKYLNQNNITDLPAYSRPHQQQETPEKSLQQCLQVLFESFCCQHPRLFRCWLEAANCFCNIINNAIKC